MDAELKMLLENIQDQVKDNKESVEKTLRAGMKGIRVYVDANAEILDGKMNVLIEADKRRNGNIQDNKDAIKIVSDNLQGVDKRVGKNEKKVSVIGWMGKRWYIVLCMIIGLMWLTAWGFHNIDFNVKKTIENTTGIVIDE